MKPSHSTGTKHKQRMLASCAAIAFAASLAGTPMDANALTPVRTIIKQDYARIIFDWPTKTQLRTSRNGKNMTVMFDRADDVAVSSITNALSPYVASARQSSDKKRLFLTLNKSYDTRNFISGTSNGIDILFDNGRGAAPTVVNDTALLTTKPVPDAPVTTPSILTTKPVPKPAAKPVVTASVKPASTPQPERSSYTPLPLAKPDMPVTVIAANDDTPPANAEPDIANDASSALAALPVAQDNAPDEIIDITIQPSAPAPLVVASALPEANAPILDDRTIDTTLDYSLLDGAPSLNVGVKQERMNDRLFFKLDKRTAVSSFQRGANLYVVLNDRYSVNTDNLRSILPSSLKDVQQIPHREATILRFEAAGRQSSIATSDDNYGWEIDITRKNRAPLNLTVPQVEQVGNSEPYVLIETLQTATPVNFTDSNSGEIITSIPSFEGNRGVYPERILPDVTVLATGQGIAYIRHHDDVITQQLRKGIRIASVDGGLNASYDLAALPQSVLDEARRNTDTFYPYNDWKAADNADFYATETRLITAISEADDRSEPELRLELVQLYMSEGMNLEALALLSMIQMEHPNFYEDQQLAALSGAANFMAGRMDAAAASLYSGAISDEDEMRFWHRMMDVVQGEKKHIDFKRFHDFYAKHYPPTLQRRIAVLAADNALANKKYSSVLRTLRIMEEHDLDEPVKDYAQYMKGRVLAENGKLEQARTLLEPLTNIVDDRFVRARATFTLATTDYKNGLIDRPALITRLEPLRHVWRGDGFELNLLHLLGELYVNNNQYLDGLRAWRDVVENYPTTSIAQDTQLRMSETFIALFNEGKANNLTPVSALALYYEFRELTPFGRNGDVMIQNLADRLANVDLLDRAASLLQHQVSFRLEKEERSKVGARLALIHLLNREPEKSLDVLELTGYGSNETVLLNQRNHLGAMSHAKIGNWQRALNILRDDYSKEAKLLRTDIYWDIKDWDNVAMSAEDVLADRDDITAKLNEDETQALLKLAVAYNFKQDRAQLQYLRDYFMPLMTSPSRKSTFDFLTSGIDPINRTTIARLSDEMSKMKSFLDSYKVTISEEGLSSAFN